MKIQILFMRKILFIIVILWYMSMTASENIPITHSFLLPKEQRHLRRYAIMVQHYQKKLQKPVDHVSVLSQLTSDSLLGILSLLQEQYLENLNNDITNIPNDHAYNKRGLLYKSLGRRTEKNNLAKKTKSR